MSNEELPPFVTLDISHISLALLVLGVYICVFGQLSYWLKEKLYISSALLSVFVGVAVGPSLWGIVSVANWVGPNEVDQNLVTYEFMRIVIAIQVMFAGISLPAAYLRREIKSITMLVLPIMTIAWLISAALIVALIPGLDFLEALTIAACITPTDPVLAASIVRGRYAEQHVSRNVRDIISAESGANDGLGFPFIFLPILLMRRGQATVGAAVGEWFLTVWLYEIILSCVMGAVIGFVARKTLKEAHKRQLVDHESFLAYGIGLAFLTLGVVGVIGSDDVLACFVAGNSLTWKDFYRIESEDDTFQDVIDSLLNASVFIYIGALIPWSAYSDAALLLTPWRMVVLAILILLLKRLPWIILLYKQIPAIETRNEAIFSGWFGPVGVSAVYYAMVALRDLPDSRTHLRAVIAPIVLFIAFASTLAHGVSIPFIKMTPKIMSRTQSAFSRTSTQTNEVFQRIRNANFNANFNKAPAATDRIVQVDEISAPLEAHLARISLSAQMMDSSFEPMESDTVNVESLKVQDDRTSTARSVSDLRLAENSRTGTPDPVILAPRVEFELPRV